MDEYGKEPSFQFETVGIEENGYLIKDLQTEEQIPVVSELEYLLIYLKKSEEYRSLSGKTQVLNLGVEESDLSLTTRRMHDFHVEQNAMKIAGKLVGKDTYEKDMTQILMAKIMGLAHDMGHTPFGHDGEVALRKELEAFSPTYTFSHATYSGDIIQALIERYMQVSEQNFPELFGVEHDSNLITPEMVQEIFIGAREHSAYYGHDRNGETNAQRSVRLADTLSFMVTDMSDLIRSGIVTEAEIITRIEKLNELREDNQKIRIDDDSLKLILDTLRVGGPRLRELHEKLIDESFSATRRGIGIRTTVVDDYKLLQDIKESYMEEPTPEDNRKTFLHIAEYLKCLTNSNNPYPNKGFKDALLGIEGVESLEQIISLASKIGDTPIDKISAADMRIIEASIRQTKENVFETQDRIQRMEFEDCPTLMTLFVIQDQIQYREILSKTPERLGNNAPEKEKMVSDRFQKILKLAYAASLGKDGGYLQDEAEIPDLTVYKGRNVPNLTITKENKQKMLKERQTTFLPLRYAVFAIQQMENADFESEDWLKSITEELGIDFEKVNEIFEKIDINAIRKECVFKDAVAFINSDNKNKVELNKMSFEEENKYKSLLAKKEPESKNRTGIDYDKNSKIKPVASEKKPKDEFSPEDIMAMSKDEYNLINYDTLADITSKTSELKELYNRNMPDGNEINEEDIGDK